MPLYYSQMQLLSSAKIDSCPEVSLCLWTASQPLNWPFLVGWSAIKPPQQQSSNMYHSPYDATSTGARQDEGVKTQMINLIGAVRTLMRCMCRILMVTFNIASFLHLSSPSYLHQYSCNPVRARAWMKSELNRKLRSHAGEYFL